MPGEPLVDPSKLDFSKPLHERASIEKFVPHRGAMLLVDAVLSVDPPQNLIVGYKDCRFDEFWTSGHFPGNPILPGVLVTEALAQLALLYIKLAVPDDRKLWVLTGLDEARFRGMVRPGDRLVLAGRMLHLTHRGGRLMAQAFVGNRCVAEVRILAVPS